MTKLDSLLEDFNKALTRLDEILKEEKTDIVRDSAIKRFEIVFDLGWKTTKALLEEKHNIICASPRNCFREAFRLAILEHDKFWVEVTGIRNYTIHTYKEIFAEKVYAELPRALAAFKKLAQAIEKSNQE
jgi:nucleotidyltransferase substrate binding protein (TIGR01987 family)